MDFWIIFGQFGMPILMVALTLAVVARSALGRAVIERLRRGGADPAAFEELGDEIARLSERLAELEERFDFTERILVERTDRTGDPPPLPSGDESEDRVATPV